MFQTRLYQSWMRCVVVLIRGYLLLSPLSAVNAWAITSSEIAHFIEDNKQRWPLMRDGSDDTGIPNLEKCEVVPQVAIFRYPDEDAQDLLQIEVLIWPNRYAIWRATDRTSVSSHATREPFEFRFGRLSDEQMQFFRQKRYRTKEQAEGNVRTIVRFLHHTLRFQLPITNILILEEKTWFQVSSQVTTSVTSADLAQWPVESDHPKQDIDAFLELRHSILRRLPSTHQSISPRPVFVLKQGTGNKQTQKRSPGNIPRTDKSR
jgi:hypothetical protein